MTRIHLITKINAAPDIVFDLSRDIDVHQHSASQTNEQAIAGTTSGLIELGETVTWQGKHFGFNLQHKSKITEMDFPSYFADEMEKGHFKSFRHEHFFTGAGNRTIMIDDLRYETPYGIFGRLFDKLLLKNHLTRFLETRNQAIKELAENRQLQPVVPLSGFSDKPADQVR